MIEYNTIFWFLVAAAILIVICIIIAATALGTLVGSDFFIDKMKEMKDKGADKAVMFIAALTLPSAIFAQDATLIVAESAEGMGLTEVLIMVAINLILLSILLLVTRITRQLVQQMSPEKVRKVKKKKFTKKLSRALTDMVDIEEEKSILLDHEYDGIQELDNNLPPWWKYGFYLTIVVSFAYMIHYHAIGTGDLQLAEYRKDIAQSEAEVEAYLESMALNVDENTAVMMTDAADLSKGKGIYIKNCAVCHLNDGGGQVGPNMTDDYWLYGPDMKNIFKTIKYGANNGMTSWKEKLTPVEIQQVASYIRTLHGTTPAIPKDPQGKMMPFDPGQESAVTDSTVTE